MKTPFLAIIGGTGFTTFEGLSIIRQDTVITPYGDPSAPLVWGQWAGQTIVFLARHGQRHTIPPHKINYRANLWALQQVGVTHIIAVAAVGGIRVDMPPGMITFPDQIIDYTWGRPSTFFEENGEHVTHIDFTAPYCPKLRDLLIDAARISHIDARLHGTYAAMQGPRLETAAEIRRLERDGCDIVGMTGMPEAALARELRLHYATCAIVANWAAGKGEGMITMTEIEHHLTVGMDQVKKILAHVSAEQAQVV